jgi:hypothetical protein
MERRRCNQWRLSVYPLRPRYPRSAPRNARHVVFGKVGRKNEVRRKKLEGRSEKEK